MDKRELVVIGGGPAGLTAGIYASRADVDTLLLERGVPGGLVISTHFIENYPGFSEGIGGPELMTQMEKQARRFGLEIRSANVDSLSINKNGILLKTDAGEIAAGAVILATGANPQLLGVKGEKEFTGLGVSYCATCDGAFFRDRTVAVVGGGDAAVEEAMFLTRFVKKVLLIHRRGELRATKIVQKRAFDNPKIEFLWHSVVDEIYGNIIVEGIKVRDVRSNEIKDINVDGVFLYVGNRPNSQLVKDMITLDDKGYIITDENMLTSQAGIYAAGDVRSKLLRQVVTAVGDGAIAAVAAEKYLTERKAL
ncbi:thioredoxin-disulfide reductase [Pelotomaculum propionicicum]|uniref:Thioredoxin reductase n=1 Tax=Pelotomaculum propionicicum TaxID=258475 RepID=A0A4Y7RNK7_9FIRM|nr:thioredoxin-disulfide reductase [Pelotomaculum propionicicum]TEB09887.1 Thioredoxin reductase [Pelotomaculum propionicicum]